MKKQILILGFLGLFLIYLLNACTADKVFDTFVNCDQVAVTYDNQVFPVLESKCATSGCHNSTDAVAGVVVTNYNSLKPYLLNGRFTAEVITDRTMPLGENNALTKEEYNLMICWEEQGFLENTDTTTTTDLCPNTDVTYTNHVKGLLEQKCADAGCHSPSSNAGNLNVLSFTSLSASINSGNFDLQIFEGGKGNNLNLLPPEVDLLSCWKTDGYQEGASDTCVGDYSYNSIKPILQTHCAGCHNATTPQSGIDVTSFAGMAAALAANPLNSITSFETRGLIQQNMPPAGSPPMSQSELDSLDCWRKAGFPEN